MVLERLQRRRGPGAMAAAAARKRLVRRANASPARCAQQGDAGRGSRFAWTPCVKKSDLGSPCGVGHGD